MCGSMNVGVRVSVCVCVCFLKSLYKIYKLSVVFLRFKIKLKITPKIE